MALFFFRSFVLYVDIINPVGMEECHSGAVAHEILRNGFQFPIEQYTPEYYENSIIVESLLTVVPVKLLGLNQLSVELVPFLLSFATMLIFCSLLLRGGYKSGLWFFIVSYFFVSAMFEYLTMDSVGNHVIGLFFGVLELWLFTNWHSTGKARYFHTFMFLAGLGLFMHLGSLLYAGLCGLVWLVYIPASGRRPRPDAPAAARGFVLFLIGAIPFVVFLVKTGMMSALYLTGVVGRRSGGVEDWGSYWRGVFDQLLVQFDGRHWLLVFYLACSVFAWLAWRAVRGKNVPEEKRLLCCIACVFPAPVFLAVVVVSGGQVTTYHTYFLPLLFLSGAIVFSLLLDGAVKKQVASVMVQAALSLMLVGVLLFGGQAKPFNLSPGRALGLMTSDAEHAYCYWRFGRSFGNYVRFKGDTGRYASDMLAACGRLDTEEKKNECLWGWSSDASSGGFELDARAVAVLGPEASGLVARSEGGWAESVLTCFKVHEAYIDDCLLGLVERKAAVLYTISPPGPPAIHIPCLPRTPRFSGLVEAIRDQLRQGSLDDGPQNCPGNIDSLCIMSDAYCAAVERRMDFCDVSYESAQNAELCRFIFQHVWKARETKEKMNRGPGRFNR